MQPLEHALSQGRRPSAAAAAAATPARPSVLVAGAGGALGSRVLERLLGSGAFAPVQVLATQPFHATTRGLQELLLEDLRNGQAAPLALVVFDAPRRANGRDDAFLAPQPQELAPLAARLHAAGARDLLVVMPHAAASLPDALQAGLANLSEQAVASLGFTRVAILRAARPAPGAASRGLQRLADTLLEQLRLMLPQHRQPVRADHVARVAVAVARELGRAAPGTRVLAPERVWQAAQLDDPTAWVRAWLAGQELPDIHARAGRM